MSVKSDEYNDAETARRLDRALKRSVEVKPQKQVPLSKSRARGAAKKKPPAKPHK